MSSRRRATSLLPRPGLVAALVAGALSACGGSVDQSPDPLALSAAPLDQATVQVAPSFALPAVEEAPRAQDAPAAEVLPPPPTVEITVRHGETLVALAGLAGCPVEDLAAWNGLDVSTALRPGQALLLPVDRVDGEALLALRDEALAARLDRYLRARGGVAGVRTHRVRTGETAWAIARDGADVPTWVLAAYNPDLDLDHLRIGDSLQVPVLAELVAEAGTPQPGPPAP